MNSYNPDALRVSFGGRMVVVCRNKSYANVTSPLSTITEEPDTGSLFNTVSSRESYTDMVDASIEMVTIDW